MIESIKNKIAEFVISSKLKHKIYPEVSFSSALRKSFSYLILMPENDKDYREAFSILEYLDLQGKVVTILTNDFRVSLLPAKFRNKAIGFSINEVNKIKLPSHKLLERLKDKRYDVIIDLNRNQNLFFSFIANIIPAKLRIGFSKKNADRYYNFVVNNSDTDSQKSYNNFLNCIKMF